MLKSPLVEARESATYSSLAASRTVRLLHYWIAVRCVIKDVTHADGTLCDFDLNFTFFLVRTSYDC